MTGSARFPTERKSTSHDSYTITLERRYQFLPTVLTTDMIFILNGKTSLAICSDSGMENLMWPSPTMS